MSSHLHSSSSRSGGDAFDHGARHRVRAAPAALGVASPNDEPVFATHGVRDLLGFPVRAVRRHFGLVVVLFSTVAASALLAAWLLPRHYLVETKLIADKNLVMPALDNPRRAVPDNSDTPTRLAAEAVMKRDNLVEIIRETNLLAEWPHIRSPLGELKDQVLSRARGPMSTDERMRQLVGMLEKRLFVTTEDGTVTIGVDWMDPQTAYRLVQSAEQNFVEQRHASEDSMITESIQILQNHVATAQQQIEEALDAMKEARPSAPAPTPLAPAIRRTPVAPRPHADEIAALQSTLTARRLTITDLESSRNQRLAALQTHLAELRNTYGPAHPEVASTEENIRALSVDSPQLASLRAEVASLEDRIQKLGGRPGDAPAAPTVEPSLARVALERLARDRPDSNEDPEYAYARSRLKIATNDYEDLLDRLQGARIELETSRAAFKYRFNVVTPPEVPRRAVKPNVVVLLGGGVILAVMLGVISAVLLDLLGGRILEPWQVDRQVGLRVLADVPNS